MGNTRGTRTPDRAVRAAVATAAAAALAAAAGCAASASTGPKSVNVVGFSVLQTANKKVISDFQKTKAGKGTTFTQSYGASGDQARAIVSGLPADEAHLSLEPDMDKLVQAKVVSPKWQNNPSHGVLTQSVVAIGVRKGNPLHIHSWADLTKPGVKIVTPNPGSSGSAKWNILAAYGHVLAQGGTPAQASAYMKKLVKNVVALPGSGHDATTAFESGTGNVLLTYEDEAIEARQSGGSFDYLVPPQTLLIQNPGAVTTNASSAAKSFFAFQQSKQGQTDYAEEGFRPLVPGVKVPVKGANDPSNPYPKPKVLMTIDKTFGGWTKADPKFFDPKTGIITKLLASAGKG